MHSPPRKRRLLVWGHCSLDKNGSFEDYLTALCREAGMRGWEVTVRADRAITTVRSEIADTGASFGKVRFGRIGSSIQFVLAAARADIVHCHFGSPSTPKALLVRLFTLGRTKVVITDHGSRPVSPLPEPTNIADRMRAAKRHACAAGVDAYLPVSEFVRARMTAEVSPCPGRVSTVLNGVDLRRFSPLTPSRRSEVRARLGLDAAKPIVIFAGQLCHEKGVRTLVDAQRSMLDSTDCTFVWAGDGPLRREVEGWCMESAGRAVYLGRRDDLQELIGAADIAVVPSEWAEAFSLALAEAAACSIPAVASQIGGIPEVVEAGVTGLLVEPGSAPALTGALTALLDDPELRAEFGMAARLRAERLFDVRRMVDETLDIYGRLTNRGIV